MLRSLVGSEMCIRDRFYVEWNSHEPELGVYKFTDNVDIEKYLEVIKMPSNF